MKSKNLNSSEVKDLQISELSGMAKRTKIIIASSTCGFLILLVSYLTLSGNLRDLGIIFALLVGLIPFTSYEIIESRKRRSIDRNLPVFLLTILSSVQSGSSLIDSIRESADRNLGALTPELRRLRANISWGLPIEDSFEIFSKRLGTVLGRRVALMLEIAVGMGGEIQNTLTLVQKHVSELESIEAERRANLNPYLYVVYVSFMVFLGISLLLTVYFFGEVESLQGTMVENSKDSLFQPGSFTRVMSLDITSVKVTMFHLALIESVFGGLAAGKLSTGTFSAGVKHSIIMLVITLIAFSSVGITQL